MPWSGRAGTAYSNLEVRDGTKLTTHTPVFMRSPIRGRENEYLLIWTTRPWTLCGNADVAVTGEMPYARERPARDPVEGPSRPPRAELGGEPESAPAGDRACGLWVEAAAGRGETTAGPSPAEPGSFPLG